MKTVIALLVTSIALIGGVEYVRLRYFPKPKSYSGRVVKKEYSPSTGNGQYSHPDRWWVYIQDSLGVHPTQVDMITFHQIRVGQDTTLPNTEYR